MELSDTAVMLQKVAQILWYLNAFLAVAALAALARKGPGVRRFFWVLFLTLNASVILGEFIWRWVFYEVILITPLKTGFLLGALILLIVAAQAGAKRSWLGAAAGLLTTAWILFLWDGIEIIFIRIIDTMEAMSVNHLVLIDALSLLGPVLTSGALLIHSLLPNREPIGPILTPPLKIVPEEPLPMPPLATAVAGSASNVPDPALHELNARLARGEIDEAEYMEIRDLLTSD